MSNVIIFAFRSNPIQLELIFEIAITEASKGRHVKIAWGGEDVFYNEIYKGKNSILWLRPFYRLYSRIKSENLDIELDDVWLKTPFDEHPFVTFDSTSAFDYLNLFHEEYSVGCAAISALTDILRVDVTALPIHQIRQQLNLLVSSNINVYSTATKYLDRERPAEVFVFNGRFGPESAVAAVAEKLEIKCSFYEWIANTGFVCWPFQTHNAKLLDKKVLEIWNQEKDADKANIARAWYERRAASDGFLLWENGEFHTKFDKPKTTAEFIKANALANPYIVFFQSSDDEFVGVNAHSMKRAPWLNQLEFLENIAFQLPESLSLIVRLHPHMQDKAEQDRLRWRELAARLPKVRFFWEGDQVDSYALGINAQKVICFGSTIGAEMLYQGKQVISGCDAPYLSASGCERAESYDHVASLIESQIAVEPDTVLPYGYFRAAFKGQSTKYFRVDEKRRTLFDNVDYFAGYI